jgi:hypothetical protein
MSRESGSQGGGWVPGDDGYQGVGAEHFSYLTAYTQSACHPASQHNTQPEA